MVISSSPLASYSSRDSDEGDRGAKRRRRGGDSSDDGDSKKRRRQQSHKRRRESEDENDNDSASDDSDSEEEDRPVRKRVNRIDSDDSDEEEDKEKKKEEKEEREQPRPASTRLGLDEDEEAALVKGANPLDYLVVDLPPTNGQSPLKGVAEGLLGRAPGVGGVGGGGVLVGPGGVAAATAAGLMAHIGPKNPATATAVSMGTNGLVGQEMAGGDEDEDDLLGVTDLVDYVCNSEQL